MQNQRTFERDFGLFARDHGVGRSELDDYTKFMNSYIDPSIIEERHMNVTQISVFSRLFMERILFLGSEIDDVVSNVMNSQLLYLQMNDPKKPIIMYINSPGGSVSAGLSIYDVMQYISCPVHTTCIGTAASMGAVLLSSGAKGERKALEHSEVMIHQPLGGTGRMTQASDIEIANRKMQQVKETLYKILSTNTGKPYDEIEAVCDRDHWLTCSEAIDFGLIDKMIKRN